MALFQSASKMKGLLQYAAVNCEIDVDMCADHGVKRFPTIQVAHGDLSKKRYTYTGKVRVTDLKAEVCFHFFNKLVGSQA